MNDLVTEVKTRIDIIDVIGKYVTVKKAGSNYQSLCPFHSEKTPSFMINRELQIYKCFGCGKGGDVFDFVMEMEGIEFADALNKLAEELSIDTSLYGHTKKTTNNSILYEINEAALKFYEYTLLNLKVGKIALEYLNERGLNEDHIKEFRLGYAPNSWNSLYNYLIKKKYKEADILKAGLIKQGQGGGYYDSYRGRIIFPLENQGGKVVGFSGRTIIDEDPKYINTKETPIFNKSEFVFNLNRAKTEIRRQKEVIVTEGEFDAIKPYIKGIKNIVALKGTAFTALQAKLLKRYAETAYIFFDSDSAGDSAALRGIEIATKVGLDIKVASLPGKYKDPDEAASQSIDLIYKAVENAVPAYDYYFSYALKQNDYKDALGKKNISEFLMPKINKIEDPILKDHYTKKLSELLEISEEVLKSTPRSEDKKENLKMEEKYVDPVEDALFVYLIRCNEEIFKKNFSEVSKEKLLPENLLNLLIAYEQKVILGKDKKPGFIKENKLESLLLKQLGDFDESVEFQDRVILSHIRNYKEKKIKLEIKNLTAQLKDAQELGDNERLDKLQKKFRMLTNVLKKSEKP
ncbi:DNA primase [bacterium]|nr:DNA primase [bacterium]